MVRSLRSMWTMPLWLLLGLGGVSCERGQAGKTSAAAPPNAEMSFPLLNSGTEVRSIQTLRQAQGQTVHLEGKVVGKQVPFLGSSAYALQDETGMVWVVTTGPVPGPGSLVLIRGIVRYQSINQGGQEVGELYVEQQAQLSGASVQSVLPER